MKSFVVFSDLHLHQWQYGSTIVHGMNSRLWQQVRVVKDIIEYCNNKDIREVVFCGDLLHTSNVTAEVSQAAYEAFKGFKENKIDLTIIVGNHDQASRSGETHALSWFRDHGLVIDTSMVPADNRTVAGLDATFLPYTDDKEQLESWLQGFRDGFLFLHQGVGGVEVNSKGFTLNEILTPDMVPDRCALAFTGHYHSHRAVASNLIIPGSTVQLNWGDKNETRGWLDVKVDGDRVHSVELVPSNSYQFVEVDESVFNSQEKIPDLSGNFLRVFSVGNFSPEELSQAALAHGAASVEIKQAVSEQPARKFEAKPLLSFNEMVMSYATAKEHAGVINAYDKEIGESLLKGNYNLPSV
jgi:DNA repair exonuclease SbcCD nuclease subunit